MAENRFRPTVYTLEARDVPASGVTPAQVFAAQGFVQQTPGVVQYLSDNFDQSRLGGAGASLLTAADLNRGAASTLTNFLNDALEAAAANPAAAGQLTALAGSTGVLIAQALDNAAACDALAARLGSPRLPPPPPPPTGAGNSNIGGDGDQNPPGSPPVTPIPDTPPPADGARITSTIPSVSDPAYVAVGTEGLRVRDVRVGEGTTATGTSTVSVRYRGFLISNGTSFDDNVAPGDPLLTRDLGSTDPGQQLIAGFEQGIIGMRVGGIRDIVIPAALGYGATGSPPDIPPNADLVFQVQMVSVS